MALVGTAGLIGGTPSASGNFNVTVQVSDGRGGTASQAFVWLVTAPALTLDPVLAPPASAGATVNFTVNSSGGTGLSYRWNFGDNSPDATSATPAVSHTYAAPGLYAVSVTVTDASGAVKVQSFMQAIYAPLPGSTAPSHSSNVAFDARAGASARVWLVNQDNDSLSVFDVTMSTRLAEIAVGASPRSVAIAPDGRVWVTNKGSASISVIDASTRTVVQTVPLPRASMPFGLVFAPNGSAAFVALEATGKVLKLDPASGAVLGSQDVGSNPRHLSISARSDRLLVSRFISPPLPGEGTERVLSEVAGSKRGGEVLVLNTASLSVDRTIVLEHSERPDSTVQGRGIPNYLAAAVISPSGSSAWVPSKQDNIKRGSLRDGGNNLDFQNTVRAITSRIDMSTLAEDASSRVDHDNASLASAAVFHPTGAYLFVALQTSRSIAVVDPVSRLQIMRFDAGRAPDGLAISADGLRLYVNNFMDRTLGVFDLSRLVNFGEAVVTPVATVAAVSTEKLTATVLRGKQFFYDARDPRLSRDGYMSCAACHNDGGHDGRVWDLTGLGEGLRNTINLRGRGGAQGFLHWSNNFDEVQDFEGQIRGLAGGTGLMTDAQFNNGTTSQPLGTAKAGVSPDLDALAAYVASLNAFDASPNRPGASTLSAAAGAGKAVFTTMNCASCHGGAAFTNSGANTLSNIGTVKPSSGQRLGTALSGIDVPTLRDVWATAPYLHDGSAATLDAAVRAHNNVTIADADLASLVAYLREIGSEESAAPSPIGTGLVGNYFNNTTLSGTAVLVRTEDINFNWGTGSPGSGVNTNNFSVRWTGKVAPGASGNYRFQTNSDDGVRVWVNGVLVINNWTDHSPTNNSSGNVNLSAGQRYAIVVEYYEKGGGAVMRLRWRLPGTTSYVPIPVGSLHPD
jgi:YVTN family beta-propeller protein